MYQSQGLLHQVTDIHKYYLQIETNTLLGNITGWFKTPVHNYKVSTELFDY